MMKIRVCNKQNGNRPHEFLLYVNKLVLLATRFSWSRDVMFRVMCREFGRTVTSWTSVENKKKSYKENNFSMQCATAPVTRCALLVNEFHGKVGKIATYFTHC